MVVDVVATGKWRRTALTCSNAGSEAMVTIWVDYIILCLI